VCLVDRTNLCFRQTRWSDEETCSYRTRLEIVNHFNLSLPFCYANVVLGSWNNGVFEFVILRGWSCFWFQFRQSEGFWLRTRCFNHFTLPWCSKVCTLQGLLVAVNLWSYTVYFWCDR
jgi:hypothetical protein